MTWLSTPPLAREPATVIEFMTTWKATPRQLAILHAEPGFFDLLALEIGPWLRRISDIRYAIYANATDATRKDQAWWIAQYEAMLVEKAGERARFLPPGFTKENAREQPQQRRTGKPREEPAPPVRPPTLIVS